MARKVASSEPETVGGEPPAATEGLSGSLTTKDLVLSALAFAGPLAGTAGYISVLLAYGNGLGTPSAFLLTTIALLLFSVGYGTMTRYVPNPGAFYAYITAGLGRSVGLGSSFLILASYLTIGMGFYGFAGLSTQGFVVRLGGPELAWWLYALAFWIVVSTFGYLRVDISARILGVLLVVEVAAVLVYDAVVVATGGSEGLTGEPFTPTALTSGQLGLALVFTVALFTGFEATAIYREETVDPDRTIPRATIITVAVIGAFYTLTSWSVIVGLGPSNAVQAATDNLAGSFFVSVDRYLGTVFTDLTSLLLVTSSFAAHLAIQNVNTRYIYSLAKDRILPSALGVAHSRLHSPHRASVATSIAMVCGVTVMILCGLTAEEIYARFAGGAAFTIMVAMALTAVATVVFFLRRRSLGVSIWTSVIAPAAGGLCLIFGVVLGAINFPTLIGGSVGQAAVMLVVFLVIFVSGVVLAMVLRRTRPDTYARIGRQEP